MTRVKNERPPRRTAERRGQVLLGFEVGSGEPHEIPIRNMVVAGQTQESGKTTALEALIARAGLTAVAFVTKRGERPFGDAHRILPYMKERADDWEYVLAVLEAAMKQRLYKHRSLIIEVCQTASTLADVRAAVKVKLKQPKMNGFVRSLYVELNAFLDKVVPRLDRIEFATTLRLRRGVNVIDMSDRDLFPEEMQGMVISSTLDWVHEHGEGVITSLPEAWKFLPQGRGSPVKRPAIALAREGSVLGNYVWPDSQDIGGIEKELLRSCPVWLLGVQREANEIDRTLANIPEGIAKPSKKDIATLEKGQFFACHGTTVKKVYVQPAWMTAGDARAVARGTHAIPEPPVRKLIEAPAAPPDKPEKSKPAKPAVEDDDMNDAQIAKLGGVIAGHLKPTLDAIADSLGTRVPNGNGHAAHPAPAADDYFASDADDPDDAPPGRPAADGVDVQSRKWYPADLMANNEDALFDRFRARLLKDPQVLAVLHKQPKIVVEVATERVEMDGKSLKGRLALMLHRGFFDAGKRSSEVYHELKRTGPEANNKNIANTLSDLVAMGFLTRESDRYKAVPDMKRNVVKKGVKGGGGDE
jgi:hypothetical protein